MFQIQEKHEEGARGRGRRGLPGMMITTLYSCILSHLFSASL